jgi:L-arabinonolactonase
VEAVEVVDCRNHHGEGAVWNALDRRLWWTDIEGQSLWAFDPESGASQSFNTPGRVCCFAPRRDGIFVAAFADGFAFFDPHDGSRHNIAAFEPERPETRLNDGRTDRQGRFIAGGMDEKNGAPISSVWRLDADLSLTQLFGDVRCANSTCFSPDGTKMYFADSPKGELWAFDYEPSAGAVANRRTLAKFPIGRGVPDGSCVDAQGFIWTTVWEGARVDRFAPDGRLDRSVGLPVSKPTCCAFGGSDLATLFITTSRLGSSDADLAREPKSGSLFALRPGVTGLIDESFAG